MLLQNFQLILGGKGHELVSPNRDSFISRVELSLGTLSTIATILAHF